MDFWVENVQLRYQAMVWVGVISNGLEAAIALVEKGFSDFEVFSYATDGNDGPTDSAGGWVCSNWLIENIDQARDAVKSNNAYPFLKKFNAHLMTGPTGTNINDVRGILFRPQTIQNHML